MDMLGGRSRMLGAEVADGGVTDLYWERRISAWKLAVLPGWFGSWFGRRRRVVVGSNCAKVRRATDLLAMSGRGPQPRPTRSKSTEIPKLVALR